VVAPTSGGLDVFIPRNVAFGQGRGLVYPESPGRGDGDVAFPAAASKTIRFRSISPIWSSDDWIADDATVATTPKAILSTRPARAQAGSKAVRCV
jgi:hypothetical protein